MSYKFENITKEQFIDICEDCLDIIDNERYDHDFDEEDEEFYKDLDEEELRIIEFCYSEIENIMMSVNTNAISSENLNSIRKAFVYFIVKNLWDMYKEYKERVYDITRQYKPKGGLTDEAFRTRVVMGTYDYLIYGIPTLFYYYEWLNCFHKKKDGYNSWENIADDLNSINKEDIDNFNKLMKKEYLIWKDISNIPHNYIDI